jgi:ubiquinone/menaquinone biosynthesis C-methylase UbiE
LSIFLAAGKPNLDAVGIDTCATMLEYANQNKGPSLNVTFRHMDAAEIIYPDHTFHIACAVQSAHHWSQREDVLSEVHRVLRPGGKFYIYEADSNLEDIPEGWVARRGVWPPSSLVRWNWQRFGMDEEAWTDLKNAVQASPFGGGEDGRHGFYRRMVLTRT